MMEGALDKNKIIEGGMMGEGGIETNNNSATPKGRSEPSRATNSGSIIIKPTSYDVLFGRGKPYQGHTGNIRLHKVVDAYKPRYMQSRRHEKTEIAEEIVRFIKTSPGPNGQAGRFLKRMEDEECWVPVSDTVARDKVSHALRGKPRKDGAGSRLVDPMLMGPGKSTMLHGLLGLKRTTGVMNSPSKTGTSLPMNGEELDDSTPKNGKRQKRAQDNTAPMTGMMMMPPSGGPNYFGMAGNMMMPGANLMMHQQQQQQHQQQQQFLASALAERQLAAGMAAGQPYGGMGLYGNPMQNFATMRGQMQMMPPRNGGPGPGGVMDPMLLQQLAAERQMRGGDPRFWM